MRFINLLGMFAPLILGPLIVLHELGWLHIP